MSVCDVPVDDDTAFENSSLYPKVIEAVGPTYIQPTLTSTEWPSLFVKVVDDSLVTVEDTEVPNSKLISQFWVRQGNVRPITCCIPDLG